MSNEVATTSPNGVMTIDATPRQQAWIQMANVKEKLEAALQKKELELQAFLKGTTAVEIEENLENYRAKFKEMEAQRLKFTRVIEDKVIGALMQFEKRSSPKTNPEFLKLEAKLLELKIKEKEKNAEATTKEQEKILYTAHIKNEYERQVAEFKKAAYHEIYTCYKQALADENAEPELRVAVARTINEIKFVELVRYERKFVTNEEATAIYKTIPSPSVKVLREQMIEELNRVWANYENDKDSNVGVDAEAEEKINEINITKEQTSAINTMIAQSETAKAAIIIGAGSGKKKVKEIVEVVEEDTLAWANKIMIAFTNTPQCHMYLKAKIAKKITVGQLAECLAKYAEVTGKKVAGIKYEEKKTL